LLVHFPLGGNVGFPLRSNVGDVFCGRRKYRLPAEYSIGILPLQSRISIPATRSWKLSQQYNGHDKIACFPRLGARQRLMAASIRLCGVAASVHRRSDLKPFNR
jgi:hypothetical protein